jgi:hypothetical protein
MMFVVNTDLFDLSRKGIDAGIVCKEREEAFKVRQNYCSVNIC